MCVCVFSRFLQSCRAEHLNFDLWFGSVYNYWLCIYMCVSLTIWTSICFIFVFIHICVCIQHVTGVCLIIDFLWSLKTWFRFFFFVSGHFIFLNRMVLHGSQHIDCFSALWIHLRVRHDNKQHDECQMDRCNRSCHRDCLHSLGYTFLRDIVVAKSSQIHLAFEHCTGHTFAVHRYRCRRPIDLVDNRKRWAV